MRNTGAINSPEKGCRGDSRKQLIKTATAIWTATLNLSRRTTSIKPITTNDSTTG